MASIQRIVSPLTRNVSYRAQVRVEGRAAQSATFPNRKDAQQWAASIETAINEGKYFPHRKAARTTLADAITRYRSTTLKDLKASATRETHLDYWLERLGGRALSEITPDRIAEERDALADSTFTRAKPRKKDDKAAQPKQYKRSGATVNRYLATLSHVFTVASKEWRLIDRNPVRDISKRKESRGRARFLTDEERTALLEACQSSDWKALHALVLLAISTGARRSELVRLKWSDIDMKAGRAIVHETKNGDPRVLPIVGKALEALRELKLHGGGKSEWVFPQPSGFPGPYEHFDAHWYEALASSGIEDFRFHDLRHTCASYLASQGASLLEIADVLGHRTMAMVKRYSHLAQGHKTTVVERMAREKGL